MKKPHIWLIMSGEPLEMFGSRPHRIGQLSKYLARNQSVEVTWWTTSYDHQEKKYLYTKYTETQFENVNMNFLHSAVNYTKNISLNRLRNHSGVAKEFVRKAKNKEKPVLILCCYPTIELAYAAVIYGKENNIKVIIDVRDLWPDIFVDFLPKQIRFLGRKILSHYFKKSRYIFENCHSVIAVSKGYLDWAERYRDIQNARNRVFPLGYKKHEENFNDSDDVQRVLSLYRIDENKIIIWFVGTFGQTYDLSSVITVAKELEGNSNVQFVFSGDGVNGERWKTQAKGVSNVVFTGWVGESDLKIISSVANIGLMAYRKGAPQGLPNKIFEYLSLGIPIISSLESETKSLLNLNNAGMNYDADSSTELREIIECYLLNPNLIVEHGKNSLLLFESEFSSDVVYEELSSYLFSLISKENNEVYK